MLLYLHWALLNANSLFLALVARVWRFGAVIIIIITWANDSFCKYENILKIFQIKQANPLHFSSRFFRGGENPGLLAQCRPKSVDFTFIIAWKVKSCIDYSWLCVCGTQKIVWLPKLAYDEVPVATAAITTNMYNYAHHLRIEMSY